LFGRGKKQEPLPQAAPPPPAPTLPSGWSFTAPDEQPVWPPNAPVYQPPQPTASTRPPAPANGRPSLLTAPGAQQQHAVPAGIRPCFQCALPLSASARFCRRCGTPQQPGA
jgi:hypothetical protein